MNQTCKKAFIIDKMAKWPCEYLMKLFCHLYFTITFYFLVVRCNLFVLLCYCQKNVLTKSVSHKIAALFSYDMFNKEKKLTFSLKFWMYPKKNLSFCKIFRKLFLVFLFQFFNYHFVKLIKFLQGEEPSSSG